MAHGHLSTSRDSLSYPVVQTRGPEAYTENQFFMNRETTVIPPEEVPLLAFRGTSTDYPDVNLEKRVTGLQEPGDINREISNSREDGESTDNQDFDGDNQVSPSPIDKRNSELGILLSTLHDHPKATEAHKKQIKLLKIEIEKFIHHSEEDQKLSPEDTDDFLRITLKDLKERLALIKNYLNNPAFPVENLDYLYHLARYQLELYWLPYPIFSLMVFSLTDENQSTSLPPDASEKTRKTVDRMLRNLPLVKAMSDDRIKQFINRQVGKVSDVMNDSSTDEQLGQLTFGPCHRLYKLDQNAGFKEGSSRPSELFTQQLGFSPDDINESIFPVLDHLVTAFIPLEAQFTSLLISLDTGRGYSDNQNLYDLQAERWSFAALELGLSGNHFKEQWH